MKCYPGYHLEGNECVEDSLDCGDGFFDDDGCCKECQVRHCKTCSQPDGACCSECMRGYTLEDNECVRRK